MTYRISLRIHSSRSADALRATLHAKLGKDIEILEIHTEEPPTSTLRQTVASYKTKIRTLQNTLTLVSADYDVPPRYAKKLSTLQRKKQLTRDDAAIVEQIDQFASRAPSLARMRRFLIDPPDTPIFADLAFRRRLVLAQLTLPDIIAQPEKVDATVLQAFAEYHQAFVQLFLQRFGAREDLAVAFHNNLPAMRHQLDVLVALDTLPALGAPRAPELAAECDRLAHELAPSGLSEAEVRTQLHSEPTVRGISILTPLPDHEIQHISTALETAITTKIRAIAEAGVLQLLADKKSPSAKKLSKLASLTQLHDITKLFTPRTTPALIRELETLLHTTP